MRSFEAATTFVVVTVRSAVTFLPLTFVVDFTVVVVVMVVAVVCVVARVTVVVQNCAHVRFLNTLGDDYLPRWATTSAGCTS